MAEQLSLITVNIEAYKHLDLVIPFLKEHNPDVVCLQEVFETDIPRFEQELNKTAFFVPMCQILKENRYGLAPRGKWGIAILTNLPMKEKEALYYYIHGSEDVVPEFQDGVPNSQHRLCLVAKVEKNGEDFTVITTHFTWTGNGEVSDEQRRDVLQLFKQLEKHDEFVLCGDFNAPRGGEIFTQIAAKYKDNIPADVTTTIDGQFHYAGNLQIVVDGMFSTPQYTFKSVEVLSGVSDHKAVKAIFSKNS